MRGVQRRVGVGLMVALALATASAVPLSVTTFRKNPVQQTASDLSINAQVERLEDADARAAEVKETATEAYNSNKADLELELVTLQKEQEQRAKERHGCAATTAALTVSDAALAEALDNSADMAKVREGKAKYYKELSDASDKVTFKAVETVAQIHVSLDRLKEEDGRHSNDRAAWQDAARTNTLQDTIDTAQQLLTKFSDHHVTIVDGTTSVVDVLGCPSCEASQKMLMAGSAKVRKQLEDAVTQCNIMSEGHKPLDTAAAGREVKVRKLLEHVETSRQIALDMQVDEKLERGRAKKMLTNLQGLEDDDVAGNVVATSGAPTFASSQ